MQTKQAIFQQSVCCVLLGCWLMAPAHAATELSKTRDCTDIDLEAVIDPQASRAENLERLSQEFFQSVNQVDHCNRDMSAEDSAAQSADNGAQAGAGGGGSGDGESASQSGESENASKTSDSASEANNSTSEASNMTGSASTANPANSDATSASTSLVGTNLDTAAPNAAPTETIPMMASDMAGTTPAADPTIINDDNNQTEQQGAVQTQTGPVLTNGKIPDDIPVADNDSVFEAQIRAAAMAETDPQIQKNLWNEYRRYKGLPEKK